MAGTPTRGCHIHFAVSSYSRSHQTTTAELQSTARSILGLLLVCSFPKHIAEVSQGWDRPEPCPSRLLTPINPVTPYFPRILKHVLIKEIKLLSQRSTVHLQSLMGGDVLYKSVSALRKLKLFLSSRIQV